MQYSVVVPYSTSMEILGGKDTPKKTSKSKKKNAEMQKKTTDSQEHFRALITDQRDNQLFHMDIWDGQKFRSSSPHFELPTIAYM